MLQTLPHSPTPPHPLIPPLKVPIVDAKTWKKGQELYSKGYCLLVFSMGSKPEYADWVVMPSTNLIKNHIPPEKTTVKQQVDHLRVRCGRLRTPSPNLFPTFALNPYLPTPLEGVVPGIPRHDQERAWIQEVP